MFAFPRFRTNASDQRTSRRMLGKGRPTPRFRPQLDPLEDRVALATGLTWTGAVSQSAYDPNNWAEGRTPVLEDPIFGGPIEYFDLFFPPGLPNRVCDFTPFVAAVNSITFTGSGYTLRGGGMDLREGGITSFVLSGINTIEDCSITLDVHEPNAEVIPFWITGGTLRVTASLLDVGPGGHITAPRELRQIGTGTLFLSGNNHQDSTVVEEFGDLIVGSTTALGNGPLRLGGTLLRVRKVMHARSLAA